MKNVGAKVGHDDFVELVREIRNFYGEDVYRGLGSAIARKKPHFRIIFSCVRLISRFRVAQVFMLAGVLLLFPGLRLPERGKAVFQYGLSANNIKAFGRLNGCLAPALRETISVNGRSVPLAARIEAVLSSRLMWRAATALARLPGAGPLADLQSVIGAATFVLNTRHPMPAELRVVCIACDHCSPCVGLIFAAESQGRSTCYIQHAPVSEYFPPLRYDLSILSDRASARAYDRAAARRGISLDTSVVILPPYSDTFRRPRVGNPPYRIGVCLSFLPRLDTLSVLISRLSGMPQVSAIVLRAHPRCRTDLSPLLAAEKVARQPGEWSAETFFENVDLALVPNSGVTVEALHSGLPTFFTPGVDDLNDDYYGFVAERIVPVFDPALLEDPARLSSFFDSAWERRFRLYDETVDAGPEAKGEEVRQSFSMLLANGRVGFDASPVDRATTET